MGPCCEILAAGTTAGSYDPARTRKVLRCAVEQWSAREAHNLEVAGSNPARATARTGAVGPKIEMRGTS